MILQGFKTEVLWNVISMDLVGGVRLHLSTQTFRRQPSFTKKTLTFVGRHLKM